MSDGPHDLANIARRTEDRLNDAAKQRRRNFVAEYLKDFNPTQAYLRSGGKESTCRKTPYMYLKEPYTQGLIKAAIDAIEEKDLVSNKQVLIGLLREANYDGYKNEHGARVSAWKALAKIKGMEAPIKVESTVTVRGGVMIVPMLPDSMSWEQAAIEGQAQLKEDVKS